MHLPDGQPSRITIDFSGAVHPDRGWIVGRVDPGAGRIELLSFDRPSESPVQATPAAIVEAAALSLAAIPEPAPELGDCTCPEFCERDHANE